MSQARAVVIVQTAGARLALDARKVHGVRGVPHTTPLPHAPERMLGVFHHEGKVLPLFDLIAHTDGDTHTERPRAVIAQAAEHEIGLVVEDVLEVLPLPETVLAQTDPSLPPQIARLVRGRLKPNPAQEEGGPEGHDVPFNSIDRHPDSESNDMDDNSKDPEDPALRKRLEEILEGAPDWLRRIHLQDGEKQEQASRERARLTLSREPGVHLVHMKRLVETLSRNPPVSEGGLLA